MKDSNVISCREITKYYPVPRSLAGILRAGHIERRQKLILENITFDVGRGEIFGIVGPNGAGKTTILKILSHLTSPTSGRALVCGFDAERQASEALRCIGYCISEERSFFWRLSGRQNLQFFADLFEIPPRTARSRIDTLLDMFELAEAADDRFMSYSSGMKQKLAIARSLLADPIVLLMDEPTRGLDPRAASRLRAFIREYVARQQKAVVVTTNQVSDVDNLCHRIAVMNRGRLIAQGTVGELRAELRSQLHLVQEPSFEQMFDLILERDDERRLREPKG